MTLNFRMTPFACYEIKFFFRGKRIHEDDEPPADLTERFLDLMTCGLVHPGWSTERDDLIQHSCNDNCAIEACIIIGRPYTNSVMDAVRW